MTEESKPINVVPSQSGDGKKGRRVSLMFRCVECGKMVQILYEKEVFNLVNKQMVAETEQLHCWDCIDD